MYMYMTSTIPHLHVQYIYTSTISHYRSTLTCIYTCTCILCILLVHMHTIHVHMAYMDTCYSCMRACVYANKTTQPCGAWRTIQSPAVLHMLNSSLYCDYSCSLTHVHMHALDLSSAWRRAPAVLHMLNSSQTLLLAAPAHSADSLRCGSKPTEIPFSLCPTQRIQPVHKHMFISHKVHTH